MTRVLLQLAAVLTLHGGNLETVVGNNALAPVHVTIVVRERAVVGDSVRIGAEIPALIAPREFTLQPGETQVLRVRVRRAPQAPTIALVARFEPVDAVPMRVAGVVARITMVTVLVGKVTVQ